MAGLGLEGGPARDQVPKGIQGSASSRELLYASSHLVSSGPAGGSTWQGDSKGQILDLAWKSFRDQTAQMSRKARTKEGVQEG